MPSDRVRQALVDMRDNIVLAMTFADGLDGASFKTDQKAYYAVVRALEIISEASRKLPDDLRQRQAHLPWKQIAGAGNIYRHDYQNVTHDFVWITLTRSLPPMLAAVEAELTRV